VTKNPLPWMDQIMNGVEHTNFFEQRVIDYRRGTEGSWDTVWQRFDEHLATKTGDHPEEPAATPAP
jgi:ribonucleoside-diphosphate reductase beta chain